MTKEKSKYIRFVESIFHKYLSPVYTYVTILAMRYGILSNTNLYINTKHTFSYEDDAVLLKILMPNDKTLHMLDGDIKAIIAVQHLNIVAHTVCVDKFIVGRVILGLVIVGRVIVGRVIVGRVILGRVIVGRAIVDGKKSPEKTGMGLP